MNTARNHPQSVEARLFGRAGMALRSDTCVSVGRLSGELVPAAGTERPTGPQFSAAAILRAPSDRSTFGRARFLP